MWRKSILNIFLIIHCVTCHVIPDIYRLEQYKDSAAVKRLQEYIQIDTSDSKNVELVVSFWKRQAAELGLPFAVYRPTGLPICVITLKGLKPDLPSIMLNSHADVVPVDADLWTFPPFSAHIDEKGDMFGRGTQDTKSVGIQYIEAIRTLIQNNVTLDRTVHITVVPDEETGSLKGFKPFLETDEFKSLNVGFALDEGMTSSNHVMYATYQDKRPWQLKFNIRGPAGHGSSLTNNSVMEQVQELINTAMEYRKQQSELSELSAPLDFGAYGSLNINIIKGGLATNVIPSRMSVVIDVRLSVETKVSDFLSMINSWKSKLNPGSTIEYIRRIESSSATAVDDTNPYWVAMRETIMNLGYTMKPVVCPATSDMIYLREIGIPAIGFSTRTNMVSRAHDIDEYISIDNFLRGINVYVFLIKSLANVPSKQVSC